MVSIVGTNKSKNCESLSITNSGILVLQLIKVCWVSGWIIWSKMHSDLGNVKSLNVSSIVDVISALLTFETPPPMPHMKANI